MRRGLDKGDPAGIPLGTYSWFLLPRTLRLARHLAKAHMHVLGKTGSGKSYFLAGLFLSLHQAGMPATLIDPHGDLAELVLSHLVQEGCYEDPGQYERLLYLYLPAAARVNRYLPLNFLMQPYDDHQRLTTLVTLPEERVSGYRRLNFRNSEGCAPTMARA